MHCLGLFNDDKQAQPDLSQEEKSGPAGEHHFNILDSAEVHCLGLIPAKPAQPGLSQEEKQAQRGTIICNVLDSVDALLRAADRSASFSSSYFNFDTYKCVPPPPPPSTSRE